MFVLGRVPGVGGRHGDDAECRRRAEPRERCEPRRAISAPTTRSCSPSACCSARSWHSRAGPRSVPWLLGVLGEMVAVLDGARVVPRDGRGVASAPRRVRSARRARRCRAARGARASGAIGRRRSIAPTPRCAAACRRRRIAPSRSSSTSEGDSLEIYQWTFNGMLAWDDPKHAAMLGERFAKRLWRGRPQGRRARARASAAASCRRASCRPRRSPPSSRLMRASIGRHRSSPTSSPRLPQRSARRRPSRRARGR